MTATTLDTKFMTSYTDVSSNTYNLGMTIDTLYLTAKLTKDQQEYMYDRFIFNKNSPNWHWHYSQLMPQLGFTLHALPNNSYTYKHFDHNIQLQREVTTTNYIPYSLSEILNTVDWNIKRIDLAFDLSIPKEKSLVMKHHGNVLFDEHDDYKTKYLGKLESRSPAKLASYNRNDKEAEDQTGILHDFPNRFEVRMFPASNDETMKLHNMYDDFIIKHLSKYIIVPNISDLPLNKWDKNRLFRVKNDYRYLKTLPPTKQKELKAVAKAHRIPLEQIYLDSKHEIFSFLKEPAESLQMII